MSHVREVERRRKKITSLSFLVTFCALAQLTPFIPVSLRVDHRRMIEILDAGFPLLLRVRKPAMNVGEPMMSFAKSETSFGEPIMPIWVPS